jgi:arginase
MSAVSLIQLPYDSGRFEERMGRGPRALIDGGLPDVLKERGFDVSVSSIRLPDGFQNEGNALVELQRHCVPVIRESMRAGAQPVLLSGNCAPAALSAVAASGVNATGVVWFDAHGDFNTPETSASGFLDGMALALLTGRCWPKLRARLEAFQPLPPERVVQIGVRNTDTEEEKMLSKSRITRIGANDLPQLGKAMEQLGGSKIYVHVDADVLDTSEGRANTFACSGGLSLKKLRDALTLITRTGRMSVASVTAYDPAADVDGRIGRAIPDIIALLASSERAPQQP